jgi:putative membrane protein
LAGVIDYDPKRWLPLVLRLRGTVFVGVIGRVLATAAVGALAVYLFHARGLKFPPLAHTLIGAALALLLVFRTNASYDRYWEGRKLIGQMGNRLRDLARQTATFAAADAVGAADVGRHLVLWYRLSVQALRGEGDLAALGDLATSEERARLADVRQRPYVVAGWVSSRFARLLRDGQLDGACFLAVDANLTALADALGGAERIRATPVPFAYAHHIKVFVALFCFSVPFAMVDSMGWYTPPVVAVLAFALFGIDEIGVEIEDPFGYDTNDLPLDRIGEAIDRSVKDILREATGPA